MIFVNNRWKRYPRCKICFCISRDNGHTRPERLLYYIDGMCLHTQKKICYYEITVIPERLLHYIDAMCLHTQKKTAETPFPFITCYRNQTNTQNQIQFHSLLYVFSLRDYIYSRMNLSLCGCDTCDSYLRNNLIWCEYCNMIGWSAWRKFGYTW